jgi:starch phosphorylase
MVRHTLQTLGPKVLATRMVRDYVLALYAPPSGPAGLSTAATPGAELAAWKARVRRPGRRCGSTTSRRRRRRRPEVGSTLEVRPSCRSGSSSPDDVDVQVVHGRVDEHDQIADSPRVAAARGGLRGRPAPVRRRRSSSDRPGPFGYTARVVPHHRLHRRAELGLAALPGRGAGMDSGVLR